MQIDELLSDFNKSAIGVFQDYLKRLELEKDKNGNLKNTWVSRIKTDEFAAVFKKVYDKTGLYVDGDSITLNFRGKLTVSCDYHAYKNTVILKYPESKFDFGIVYEGDIYEFKKENGKVIYTHEINDPFNTSKKMSGGYGIIKNSQGEFLELLDMDTINKMKNSSLMKFIWDTWPDRMVLKSVIKRICSAHFHDISEEVMDIDNETEFPEMALIDSEIQEEIKNATKREQLDNIYKTHSSNVKDHEHFVELLADKSNELNEGGKS